MSSSIEGTPPSGPRGASASEGARVAEAELAPQGQRVGRYLLLKAVGQGGMGVVYAAYDPELDRKVALKLLHPGGRRWDRAQARARLQREAQAMARISHPHVIPVFDVGTHLDQVFVAMEFVDGGTLSEWLKKGERGWREVLELFRQAGEGLAAAHTAGLVHRDFKPANVLLGSNGRVYVTDFGLARPVESLAQAQPDTAPVPPPVPPPPLPALPPSPTPPVPAAQGTPSAASPLITTTLSSPPPAHASESEVEATEPPALEPGAEHTATAPAPAPQARPRPGLQALTETGVIVGTPAYMPPEQYLGGAQDERSDQFSFCAALYWALYKQRPFDHQQMRSAVESSHGSDLSQRLQSLQRSLPSAPLVREPPRDTPVPAWVRRALMRGLALDPEQRFGSMRELLTELSQEPRRARRRQALVAAGVALAVLAGVGVATWRQGQVCAGADTLVAEVWGPVQRQRLESAFAATRSSLAATSAERVGQLLEGYAQAWARQRTQACEATRRLGVQSEEVLARREVCLERRRKDLGALARLLAQADARLVEKAVEVAQSLPDLGECADVESLANQQALPADPTRRAEVERLTEELAEVRALVQAGRYKDSLARAEELEPRVQATQWLPLLAEVRYYRGFSQQRLGDKESAHKVLLRALFDAEAARASRLKLLVLGMLLLSDAQLNRYEQAETWGLLADSTLEHVGREPLLASIVTGDRGWLALQRGQFEEANRLLEQTSRLMDEAGLPPGHIRRARALTIWGLLAYDQEQHARAAELFQRSLEQTEAAVGRLHPETWRRYVLLAMAQSGLGDHAAALENNRQALRIAEALHAPSHLDHLESKEYVAASLRELGRGQEALGLFRAVLEMKQKHIAPEDITFHNTYLGLGLTLLKLGRAREALTCLEKALTYEEQLEPYELGDTRLARAQAWWELGERSRALEEAALARKLYLEGQRPRLAAQVDAWLASVGAPAAEAQEK